MIFLVIKSIRKFSKAIGYHQPDLSTNRTVCASSLSLESIITDRIRLHSVLSPIVSQDWQFKIFFESHIVVVTLPSSCEIKCKALRSQLTSHFFSNEFLQLDVQQDFGNILKDSIQNELWKKTSYKNSKEITHSLPLP